MPKKRTQKRTKKTRRMVGRGNDLVQIQTANKNLNTITRLSNAKPPLQQPGQLARKIFFPRQHGGALRDKYGAYLYVPKGI